jgi:hypothetical protein
MIIIPVRSFKKIFDYKHILAHKQKIHKKNSTFFT